MNPISIYLMFGILTLFGISSTIIDYPARMVAYFKHMWLYLLFFTVAEALSMGGAVWILALISFMALREYYSLIAIRPQDRWGVLGAFLTIPCMMYVLWADWYQPFIVFILLYAFLGVSFLVVIGGNESDGTVFSIGAIDFGIFLFVMGNAHLGFLALHSIWAAVLVLLSVCLTDAVSFLLTNSGRQLFEGRALKYAVAIPVTVLFTLFLAPGLSLAWFNAVIIGVVIPMLVAVSRHVMLYIETDLGIAGDYESLRRGRLINSSCSLMMTAPVIFHYLRFAIQ